MAAARLEKLHRLVVKVSNEGVPRSHRAEGAAREGLGQPLLPPGQRREPDQR